MVFGKHFRRSEAPWEVVDSKDVVPVFMWDEDDELDVVRMHDSDMTFKLEYELRRVTDLRKVVQFARYRLLQDAIRHNYNIFLSEGWRCTLLRKDNRYRVDIVYSGRPAFALGKISAFPPPPFIAMIDHCQHHLNKTPAPPLATRPSRVLRYLI